MNSSTAVQGSIKVQTLWNALNEDNHLAGQKRKRMDDDGSDNNNKNAIPQLNPSKKKSIVRTPQNTLLNSTTRQPLQQLACTNKRPSISNYNKSSITPLPVLQKANPNSSLNDGQQCHIDCLPEELFFKIISFIGPASSDLITLTQVNRRYSKIMTQVGDAMLIRAKSSYRILLPRIYRDESLMSLCTRHVRCFQDFMNKCNLIKNILEKDFVKGCITDALTRGCISLPALNELKAAIAKRDVNVNDTKTTVKTIDPVTVTEIDQALDVALDLLGADNKTYFLANKIAPFDASHPTFYGTGRTNILGYFSEKIENQILSLCGKCGGKIFKYVKMMSLIQDYGGHTTSTLVSNTIHRWKDEERLDRARLVMQLVVHRLMVSERSSDVHSVAMADSSSAATIQTIPANDAEVGLGGNLSKTNEDVKQDSRKPFYSWLEG